MSEHTDIRAAGAERSEREQSLSLKKAVRILRCFTHDRPERGLPDIVKQVGFPRTVCYRLLSTLEEEGLVTRDSTSGRYRLTMALFALGSTALSAQTLTSAASTEMFELSRVTGDAVCLMVEQDGRALCVERVDGEFPIRELTLTVGRSQHLHVGAGPFVILAHLSPEAQDKVLRGPLPALTSLTVTDPAQIRARLAEVRQIGFVVSSEDVAEYLLAIAAPVFGIGGRFLAALSVSGLKPRYTPERIAETVRLTVAAAERISACLGYALPRAS